MQSYTMVPKMHQAGGDWKAGVTSMDGCRSACSSSRSDGYNSNQCEAWDWDTFKNQCYLHSSCRGALRSHSQVCHYKMDSCGEWHGIRRYIATPIQPMLKSFFLIYNG